MLITGSSKKFHGNFTQSPQPPAAPKASGSEKRSSKSRSRATAALRALARTWIRGHFFKGQLGNLYIINYIYMEYIISRYS